MNWLRRLFLATLVLAFASSPLLAGAAAYRLAPWKDELFKYPKVLSSKSGGNYVVVQYSEARDLDQRDAVPEKQAKPEYVSLDTKAFEQDLVLKSGRTSVKYIFVGKSNADAKAIVIYIHGRNGSRFQGANDGMFGGNFNRIKNLMLRNNGIYLSPGLPDLGRSGTEKVKALMLEYARLSPGAPIFIACGSLGGKVCWSIARDREVEPLLGGLLLLGSNHDEAFLNSAALAGSGHRFPIYLGHGTKDPIIDWNTQESFFRRVKAADPNYPIKFALFDSGTHGTPIRMTDWRQTLNWMLEVDGK